MKRIKKPVFFIIAALILVFSALTVFGCSTYYGDITTVWVKGVKDIRWGIDIRGGVDVTFTPDPVYAANHEITDTDIDAAKSIIETRMVSRNITDYEIYQDYNSKRIIVRFPWQSGEANFDPETAVKELGETALLTFREGNVSADEPNYEALPLVLSGAQVERASPFYDTEEQKYAVSLELKADGTEAFSEATGRLAGSGVISIWMDDYCISYPKVNEQISGGKATISGSFTREEAISLANRINGGALPFKLQTDSFSTISPTLGLGARDAMALAGVIAFAVIAVFMIWLYKLPGVVAVFGLMGQLFGSLAVISGFFGISESFTLTIPGIAGIVLSLGMGVDANVITSERIKEELRNKKSIDAALQSGYNRAFSAIFDGNVTLIIIAFILMGAFGTPNSFAAKFLGFLFFMFGPSTAGPIYSFGYTLIVGAVLNFIFGVFASRLMTFSISRFKKFRNPKLYGYKNKETRSEKPQFDAVKNRNKFIAVPAAIIALAVLITLIFGLKVAIEFRGGTILTYSYENDIDSDAVKSAVESTQTGIVNVTKGSAIGSNLETVTVSFSSDEGLTADRQHEITEALESAFPNNKLELISSQDVSPSIGGSFFLKCLVAVIFSFIVLIVYIGLRFRKIGGVSAGAFAIVALLNDVLVVFAAFVFFRLSIDANFMAVILTILGYSINDTIVVYDRIRENRELYGKKISYRDLVNKSVSQSFNRTLNTSVTTALALIVICIVAVVMGVTSIFSFAFPMVIGLISGFVSSMYIAGPLWVAWRERKSDPPVKA